MIAGAAPEIVRLLFGPNYSATAPLFSVLVVGAWGQAIITVASAIIIGMGKPERIFPLTAPLVPLALVGLLLAIPPFGALGASLVTATLSCAGALAVLLAVYREWRIFPPPATVVRSLLISLPAYGAALLWPAAGVLLLPKLLVIGGMALLCFYLAGELNAGEVALAVSIFPGCGRDEENGAGL
jgi:O-antigen/teichoic acid export membrane protein